LLSSALAGFLTLRSARYRAEDRGANGAAAGVTQPASKTLPAPRTGTGNPLDLRLHGLLAQALFAVPRTFSGQGRPVTRGHVDPGRLGQPAPPPVTPRSDEAAGRRSSWCVASPGWYCSYSIYSGGGRSCPSGYYCPGGDNAAPVPCAKGFTSDTGQTSCKVRRAALQAPGSQAKERAAESGC
jgi:hypothetical protein